MKLFLYLSLSLFRVFHVRRFSVRLNTLFNIKGVIVLFGAFYLGSACVSRVIQKTAFDSMDWVGRAQGIEMHYKQAGLLVAEIHADNQEERLNGDIIFEKGIFIKHFDNQQLVATLLADTGLFVKEQEIYQAYGNVQVHNFERADTLYTELLTWDPNAKHIYTDSYVEIRTKEDRLQGYGLYSSEDLKEYRILKPVGTLSIP